MSEGIIDPSTGRDALPKPLDVLKRLPSISIMPLHNWAFILEVDATANLKSGLVVPGGMWGATFRRGVVIETGPGTTYGSGNFVAMSIKRGDVVIFGKSGSMEVMLDEGAFLLMRESEIMGVIKVYKNEQGDFVIGAKDQEASRVLQDC